MTAHSLDPAPGLARERLRAVRGWRLWTIPPKAVAVIVCVELVTVLAVLVSLVVSYRECLTAVATSRLLLLLVLAVAYSEITYRMQRMRRFLVGNAVLIGLHSVWAFAGVLILPIGYSATLVCGLFLVAAMRRRQQKAVAYRLTYTGATVVLATLAAKLVITDLQPDIIALPSGGRTAMAITAAALAFFLVNTSLVVAAVHLATGAPLADLTPAKQELGLEAATLVLGVMIAETSLRLVWFTPTVLILLVLLQRSSLVSQLEVAATTDSKTGLLNAAAWQELSQRELVRAQRDGSLCAVLLIDLDHFKRVNDTAGHLAGDAALRAIGDALKRELRGYDAVARFGGEEFVVFLDDLGAEAAGQVAERVLARIRGLVVGGGDTRISLTASIGMAAYPQHGQTLTELMEQADGALYTAKRSGRDRVGLPGPAGVVAEIAAEIKHPR
ncbi:GGDEF domain-containing protein [Jatrophihabitans sp.]|uniref:GGDEF domain-containing protein n=1 Tax=Jatrophihabitans sp. TaxID=1932789 RepID=UPI002B56679D|nr:GGDEF domain-containing protein [Jatrophihabitans sp.]